MPIQSKTAASRSAPTRRRASKPRMLLVEAETEVGRLIGRCAPALDVELTQAKSLPEARQQIEAGGFDLALIDPGLADGSAAELAEELRQRFPRTHTIFLTAEPDTLTTVDAMRRGVVDLLVKPLDSDELDNRLRVALARQQEALARRQRMHKLERTCRRLRRAREEVTHQVDVLCNDLVTAYQELANQMHHVVQTTEFSSVIRQELDLEQLLRKTLEFILEKAGPTNAAVFLPANRQEYALGGYVNYDTDAEAAEVLMQHLADVMAPAMGREQDPVLFASHDALKDFTGQDAGLLSQCQVLSFTCWHAEEPLAVIVLFRDQQHPFDPELRHVCQTIGPMLGEYLARIIRVHHRHLPDDEADLTGTEDW